MTKTELEQVREALADAYEFGCRVAHVYPNDIKVWGNHWPEGWNKALALIDAELAKPEAREWRAAHDVWFCPKRGGDHRLVASDCGEIHQSKNKAQADENLLCNATGEYRALNVRIEFRAPAGPWERAE